MINDTSKEAAARGWKAIDEALDEIYHGVEPKHMAPMISYRLGGDVPLDGISAYKRDKPVPHWHFITYGFTELYEKESENQEYSGVGFELTFRVKTQTEEEPPNWAFNFLVNLSSYVFNSGNSFSCGDYLNANGPIALDTDTELAAVAFVDDPELPTIETPNGKVEFLQVVGITLDEERAIKSWNCAKVMGLFRGFLPCYITDLARKSLLCNKSIQAAVDEGVKIEGSSTGVLFTSQLVWNIPDVDDPEAGYQIVIGANLVRDLFKVLPGRILHNRELVIHGNDRELIIKPGKTNDATVHLGKFIIQVNKMGYDEIITNLSNNKKQFALKSVTGLVIKVEKTEIKSQSGEIVQIIEDWTSG